CGRCRQGRIRRTVQAQRSTFFCPACQLRRGRHSSWVED
ncbi:formamidopyrimidine-DNA glycosylase, partial [Rubripirellula sp.]|nr:formamidopyrimidine-DNA glycosylase [Rubripirellula sp.]